MSDKIFVDGLIAKKPSDKAPDFVKANLSIKVEDLGKFLREKYKAGEEWVNVDIKESQNGKWYAEVNTWKPEKKEEAPKGGEDFDQDIPFAQFEKNTVA